MRYIVLVLVLLGGVAVAGSPLESDCVMFSGEAQLTDGSCVLDAFLPAGVIANGFYINVAGVEQFEVYVAGVRAASVKPDSAPRAFFRMVDLTDYSRLLRAGSNRIELRSSEPDRTIRIRIWTSSRAWYICGFHAHTTYSDGTLSVHELLQEVLADGGDAYAITDHETMAQTQDTAFHPVGGLQPIRGYEWTDDSGHANILGLEGNSVLAHGSVPQMIDDASWRGAMVQINQPHDLGMEWLRRPLLDPGVDVIEVFNSVTWFPPNSSDEGAVAWWNDLLCQGKTVAAVGNPDFHWFAPEIDVLKSCSRIFAPSNVPDTVLKYIKLGKVMVNDDPTDSRVYVYADTNNNGSWDLTMGDIFRITSGLRTVRFRMEVEEADPLDKVYVYNSSGLFYSRTLWTGGDMDYEWTQTYSANDRDFVRVELRAQLGADHEHLTNPIYINYPDYELGPVRLATAGRNWPDTTRVGQIETLWIRLRNTQGVSPYRTSLIFAVDTADFDIVGWVAGGQGIGTVRNVTMHGYEFVEWQAGYTWDNRLRPGTGFDYWLTVQPKQVGKHPLFYRSSASDRLFTVDEDPKAGVPGPAGQLWYVDSLFCEPGTGVAQEPSGGEREVLSVSPSCVREWVQLNGAVGNVVVRDVSGRVVRFWTGLSQSNRLNWDLTDTRGSRVAPGVYFICGQVTPSGEQSDICRIVVMR